MRSNEERVAAVKRRMAQLEEQKRRRRSRIAALSSVTVCLAIIVAAAFAIPGIAARFAAGDYAGYETAASIFGGSVAIGYIVIGLLAFVLGVLVTVLCFKLRDNQKKDGETEESDGGAD